MNPRRLNTRPSDRSEARGRLRVGRKYLEVADLLADESGETINVCVGVAVLAGIAATLLARVDQSLGKRLGRLIGLKSESQYGAGLLTSHDRQIALREATALIDEAETRLIG